MRRIYESDALSRDDDEPFSPRERRRDTDPQSFRSVNASAWSDRLLPHALRRWGVSVQIATPAETFERGTAVPFRVTMTNSLSVPLTIETRSPLRWTWGVDGFEEASHVESRAPPEEASTMRFDRGETKEFQRRWSGLFRVAGREWEPADRGEHTLRAALNVEDADAAGLADETTIRIS
jgi:hypothetical protein